MIKGRERVGAIVDQLNAMGLARMALALDGAYSSPDFLTSDRLDLIGSIVASEYDERASRKLSSRLRKARLSGCPADISKCGDSAERGYQPAGVVEVLSSLAFVRDGLNVLILGASASGKTYLAKAIGTAACGGFGVEYRHCDSLLYELADAKARNVPKFEKRMRQLAKVDLLIIDDFLIAPTASDAESSIMFQILERRTEARKSTVVCSQRNPDGWTEMLSGDEVIANAIVKRATRHYTVLITKKDG